MKCPKCGEELDRKDKFCKKCGINIEQALNERVKKEAEAKAKADVEIKEKMKKDAEKRKENNDNKAKDVNAEISDPDIGKEVEKIKKEYNEKNIEEKVVRKEIKQNKQNNKSDFKKIENKKIKKNNIFIKIIFILIIIIVMVIGIVYGLYEADLLPNNINDAIAPTFEKVNDFLHKNKDFDNEYSNEENTIENSTENKKINKIDEEKELVYDSYTTVLNDKTSRVPKINLNYEHVNSINNEISNLVEDKLKVNAEETPKDGDIRLINVDYRWYQNDQLLSLVVKLQYENETNQYYVFNINVYDGEDVQNSKILEMAKIPQGNFTSKCLEATKNYFDKLYAPENVTNVNEKEYNKARDNSLQESNFSVANTQMYLNDGGELMIVSKIYKMVGTVEDEKCLNLEYFDKNVVNSVNDGDTKIESVENATTNDNENKDFNNVVKNETNGNSVSPEDI